MKDDYSTLEINEAATADEIKSAFRRLMKVWHPIVCSRDDDGERFVDIVDAYNILNDPIKHEEYDEERKEMGLQQSEEQPVANPTTLSGCLIIMFLIIISLGFVGYIAFKVYMTLHGAQTINDLIQ